MTPDSSREFADIARQEYVAVGIRVALHPLADLATEPRWARAAGTFGEDAELAAQMVAAYIRGFQGESLGPESVACMTKHFPGGGPQRDGEDPHFPYGREQVYPGGNFDYHLIPFEAALEAGTAQVMPYYGMPVGTDARGGRLRLQPGRDHGAAARAVRLRRHRLHRLGPAHRHADRRHDLAGARLGRRAPDASRSGCSRPSTRESTSSAASIARTSSSSSSAPGRSPRSGIDASVRRLLRDKFRLGLFDDPYVDPDAAAEIVGQRAFREQGDAAQRRVARAPEERRPAAARRPAQALPRGSRRRLPSVTTPRSSGGRRTPTSR